MNRFAKTISILALILTVVTAAPTARSSVEFGLTPSPVYGLWNNINRALMAYARLHSSDTQWLGKLANMEAGKFSGKVPANVLKLAKRFDAKLSELNERLEVEPQDVFLNNSLLGLLSNDVDSVTPSQVFLLSGQMLIGIIDNILHTPAAKVAISPFFEENTFTDKSPSDVFGLVDLALRRLDAFLVHTKTSPLATKDTSR